MGFPLNQVLQGKRREVLNPLSPRERERILGSRMYVVNLTDLAWPPVQRPYGVYIVPPATKGKDGGPGVLAIAGRIDVRDTGDDKAIEASIEAEDIARDIAREINENCTLAPEMNSYFGVFVSETPEPTKERIAEETEKLVAYQDALVLAGFKFWSEEREHKSVTQLHRWALKQRGGKADWLFQSSANEQCRACHELIPPESAKCPKCHAVLNMEKMKEFFPLEYAAILEKAGETAAPKAARAAKARTAA